jgi:hypothetical protein
MAASDSFWRLKQFQQRITLQHRGHKEEEKEVPALVVFLL